MDIQHKDLVNLGEIYERSAMGRNIDALIQESTHNKATLSLKKKPETGEWVVRYIVDGKVDDAKSYYTDDQEDAKAKMAEMQKEIDNGTVNEGFFDRIGDRVSAAAGTAKDTWGNVKASAQNVKQTMSGERPTGKGKNLSYSYNQRKAERVISRHLGRIKNQLSEFATDLTKLGVVTADEAESIAKQAYSAVEKTRTLKKTKNLYDVK